MSPQLVGREGAPTNRATRLRRVETITCVTKAGASMHFTFNKRNFESDFFFIKKLSK